MRIYKYLIKSVLISIFFFACKKETEKSTIYSVTGKWQWVQSYGGIGGVIQLPEPGNVYKLEVNPDYTFLYTRNGAILRQGHYTLDFRVSFITNQPTQMIDFDDNSFGCLVQGDDNNLVLIDDVFDSVTSEYRFIE